jgi:hypothetical protein
VTILKPYKSICPVKTVGEETAEAASKVDSRSADSFEGEAICADPEIATAA